MHLNEFVTWVKVGMGMFEVNFETLKPMQKIHSITLNKPKQHVGVVFPSITHPQKENNTSSSTKPGDFFITARCFLAVNSSKPDRWRSLNHPKKGHLYNHPKKVTSRIARCSSFWLVFGDTFMLTPDLTMARMHSTSRQLVPVEGATQGTLHRHQGCTSVAAGTWKNPGERGEIRPWT